MHLQTKAPRDKVLEKENFAEVYLPCFFPCSDRTVPVFYSVPQGSKMACPKHSQNANSVIYLDSKVV